MQQRSVHQMVITGLLTALVYLFTRFIYIQPPFALNGGGLIHLGNVMIVISCVVFGKKTGALASALGMTLFDLTSGYAIWAPFTFVIRGVMGYILGHISHLRHNGNSLPLNALAVIVSGFVMVAGYYVAQAIMFGNWLVPMASVPGDLIQVAAGLVFGLPLTAAVKRVYRVAQ